MLSCRGKLACAFSAAFDLALPGWSMPRATRDWRAPRLPLCRHPGGSKGGVQETVAVRSPYADYYRATSVLGVGAVAGPASG